MEDTETRMKPMSEMMNLFGTSVPISKTGRPLSERQTLTKYFVDRAHDLKGPVAPGRMGFMLSHLKTPDLYYMKSVLESETRRPDNPDLPRRTADTKWNQIFWGMLKPQAARSS